MSLGRIKLKQFIESVRFKKMTQDDVAKKIGCSGSYLSELISGVKAAPSIKLAGRIEIVTKVKVGDWNKPEVEHAD